MSTFPYHKMLSKITVDFIESSWNAAQRSHAYICDFGLENKL